MSFSTGKKSLAKAVAEKNEAADAAIAQANNLIITYFTFAGIICAAIATGNVKSCKKMLNSIGINRWISIEFLKGKFMDKVEIFCL